MFGSVFVWFCISPSILQRDAFPLQLMSDSQRFYPPVPEYLLFSTPVGALWEWKHSVMTPNPPHKAQKIGPVPHAYGRLLGGGRVDTGRVWTLRRPMGSDKSPRFLFRSPPPPPPHPSWTSSVLSVQTLIKDLLSGQVQTSSQGAMFSMFEMGKGK